MLVLEKHHIDNIFDFRILEFEQSGIQVNGRSVTAEVEMWDVSGDHK